MVSEEISIKDVIEELEYYNKWRRQDTDDPTDRMEQPSPTRLGMVIDEAVGLLKGAKRYGTGV